MTHTWADVAYGFFVGGAHGTPTIVPLMALVALAFIVWRFIG